MKAGAATSGMWPQAGGHPGWPDVPKARRGKERSTLRAFHGDAALPTPQSRTPTSGTAFEAPQHVAFSCSCPRMSTRQVAIVP